MRKSHVVLMVEDNENVLALNRAVLEHEGCSVLTARSIAETRSVLADAPPIDVVVLDLLLPDGDGLDFIPELRRRTSAPVLVLTCKRDYADIVEGLTGGADDYMTKPYRIEELLARITALARKCDAEHPPTRVTRGLLALDAVSHRAYLRGEDLLLKPREFAVLQYLVRREGEHTPAERLYEEVWNLPATSGMSAVKTVVSRLRKKLAGSGYAITSGRGKGYCFKREE